MSARRPPPVARWLAEHLAGGYQREAFIGDLAEEYARGRSRSWYWKQVVFMLLWAGSRARQAVFAALSLRAPSSILPRSVASLLRRMTLRLVSILLLTALGVGTLTWAATRYGPSCSPRAQTCHHAR